MDVWVVSTLPWAFVYMFLSRICLQFFWAHSWAWNLLCCTRPCVWLWEGSPDRFPKRPTCFPSPAAACEVPVSPHSCRHLPCTVFSIRASPGSSKGHLLVELMCMSRMASVHFPTCFLVIRVCLWRVFIQIFCPFERLLLVSSLYVLDVSPLWETSFTNIVFLSGGYLFIF